MKESRKSVVMGAEMSNLRSFRVRAKEEALARQQQTALELERLTKTHKHLSKRRRMHMQTIVVRSSANYHDGNHMYIPYIHHSCMHTHCCYETLHPDLTTLPVTYHLPTLSHPTLTCHNHHLTKTSLNLNQPSSHPLSSSTHPLGHLRGRRTCTH